MRFRCAVQASYDSALFIPGDGGPAGRTHGHRYTVEAVLETQALDDQGFVADFDDVQSRLQSIARELDHRLLNDLDAFKDGAPSAERQALFFFRRMQSEIEAEYGVNVRLVKVRIYQEPDAWVEYAP